MATYLNGNSPENNKKNSSFSSGEEQLVRKEPLGAFAF
jgi:hypothetical protein